MSTEMYLSRLELKKTPEIAALAATLTPNDEDEAIATDHRLIRSAYGGAPNGRVLWRRETGRGRYLALSPAPPPAETAIFATQSKPFQPALSVGDRLAFALRVNATVARKDGAGRGRRHDVAMDALKDVASGGRAALRQDRAESAARDWLETRAEVSGFRLTALRLHSYRAARLPRRGGAKASFGVFDLEGLLEIADPPAFLERLRQGFGRAKAFGCGLMLIRRAG